MLDYIELTMAPVRETISLREYEGHLDFFGLGYQCFKFIFIPGCALRAWVLICNHTP
jgi:hypothetical protein